MKHVVFDSNFTEGETTKDMNSNVYDNSCRIAS